MSACHRDALHCSLVGSETCACKVCMLFLDPEAREPRETPSEPKDVPCRSPAGLLAPPLDEPSQRRVPNSVGDGLLRVTRLADCMPFCLPSVRRVRLRVRGSSGMAGCPRASERSMICVLKSIASSRYAYSKRTMGQELIKIPRPSKLETLG